MLGFACLHAYLTGLGERFQTWLGLNLISQGNEDTKSLASADLITYTVFYPIIATSLE